MRRIAGRTATDIDCGPVQAAIDISHEARREDKEGRSAQLYNFRTRTIIGQPITAFSVWRGESSG